MRAAALALLLALPAHAQEVQDGYLRLVDGATVQVRGGVYMPSEKAQDRARELLSLRAENARLKSEPVATPASLSVAVLTGIALGLAGGIVIAFGTRER